jgi:hypothetical protein
MPHPEAVQPRVGLCAAQCRELLVVRLSLSATYQNAPPQGAGTAERRSRCAISADAMQGVGMAACPRSRHSFKSFVRTGDDAAGSKNRSYAQVVSRTQRIRAVIAIGCRKDRDNDWCSDACQKLWPRRLVMQAFDTFTEAAARSASRVHPPPPLGGTAPRATAVNQIQHHLRAVATRNCREPKPHISSMGRIQCQSGRPCQTE